jgi:hypothetical protein
MAGQKAGRSSIWVIVTLVAAVVVFLLGYVPGAMTARSAQRERDAVSEELKQYTAALARAPVDRHLPRLEAKLGIVLYEANRNNFASAAARSSEFFDGVRSVVANPQFASGSNRRAAFEAILNRRDEISGDLARADQGVKEKLAQMYAQFDAAVQAAGQ